MKYTVCLAALFVLLAVPAQAQRVNAPMPDAEATDRVSAGKAFALSLVVPGLGHRYVHGGDWDGWASVFAVADAGLWSGLLGMIWRRGHVIDSYETLAIKHAEVDRRGKDRTFYLNAASYPSSDAYTEAQLRSRNWGQVGYADDPSHQWNWDTEANFLLFRELREDAESLGRRRSVIITSLVANRLLAGITALRAARRASDPELQLSVNVPPSGSSVPMFRLNYGF